MAETKEGIETLKAEVDLREREVLDPEIPEFSGKADLDLDERRPSWHERHVAAAEKRALRAHEWEEEAGTSRRIHAAARFFTHTRTLSPLASTT